MVCLSDLLVALYQRVRDRVNCAMVYSEVSAVSLVFRPVRAIASAC